jgi:pimeloyl-ACP methyl ester carboxylesterase
MKRLLFLHGNPLDGREFDGFLPELQARDYYPIIHKRPQKGIKLEPLLQSISATAKVSGGSPFGLVAYSWGAYLALAYLKRFPENLTEVLLINPLVVSKAPVSRRSLILMSFPLLGRISLKMRRVKNCQKYIHEIFSPLQPSKPAVETLESLLTNGQVWKCCAKYKALMQKNPLTVDFKKATVPVKVLFGECDRAAPPQDQLQLLRYLPKLDVETIPGASHALPWTHGGRVMENIIEVFG